MSKKHNEFSKEMVEACPLLYGYLRDEASFGSTRIQCSFGIGRGWFDLVSDLSLKIEMLIQKMPKENRSSYRACQVIQKWGELSFYLNAYTDEMITLIKEAKALSRVTCEVCGAEGYLRNVLGWNLTLCDSHYEVRLQSLKGGNR